MSRVVGIAIGSHSARIVEGRQRKGAFEIHGARQVEVDHLAGALAEMGLKGAMAYVGVTGRDVILRTMQVPPVPAWQLKDLMGYEIDEISEQSGDVLSADYNLLDGAALYSDEDMVLLALVRESLIEDRSNELKVSGLSVAAFTPNAVGLYNAFTATDGRDGTIMVAALGGRNTDVALIQDGDLLFARNLSGGGEMMTQAVATAFGVDHAKAEAAKRKMGRFAGQGESLPGKQGAVATALDGSLRQIAGMLNSSLVLCRTQLGARELSLDGVLLCGPGARLEGLDQAMTRAMGVPVEIFDPAEGYVVGDASELEDHGSDFAVAVGLAMMGGLRDSYRIEILSEGARRKKEFSQKTVWLLAAAAVVLANIALFFVTSQANSADAERDLGRMRSAVQRRQSSVRDYERAGTEVRELSARMEKLEDRTAPGAGVLTVLDVLETYLPDELWIIEVRTMRVVEPLFGHGGKSRPIVTVEGRGKEVSRNLGDAVTELVTRLRDHPRIAGVLPQMDTDNRGEFTWNLKIDTSLFPNEGEEDPVDDDLAMAGQPFSKGGR